MDNISVQPATQWYRAQLRSTKTFQRSTGPLEHLYQTTITVMYSEEMDIVITTTDVTSIEGSYFERM